MEKLFINFFYNTKIYIVKIDFWFLWMYCIKKIVNLLNISEEILPKVKFIILALSSQRRICILLLI